VFTESIGSVRVAASVERSHEGRASRHVEKSAIAASTAILAAAFADVLGSTDVGDTLVTGTLVGRSDVVAEAVADTSVVDGPDASDVDVTTVVSIADDEGPDVESDAALPPELQADRSSMQAATAPTLRPATRPRPPSTGSPRVA